MNKTLSRLNIKKNLKIAFPLIGIAIIGFVFLEFTPNTQDKISTQYVSNHVTGLFYSSSTENGNHFTIQSERGDEAGEKVNFDKIMGALDSQNGKNMNISANQGTLDKTDNSVQLDGEVKLLIGQDFTIQTQSAHIDTKAGNAAGKTPVSGSHKDAKIKADGFRIENNGTEIVLVGNPELVLSIH